MLGAVYGRRLESMPIASAAKIKVISLDYRQNPEHRFPAGSDDVTAIYREF
jgi:monoterpene epsilon-lactone hydrolase